MPDNVLPTPAAVRCELAVDLLLQIRALLALSPHTRFDPDLFADHVVQFRNSQFMNRLELVVPKGEIALSTTEEGLSLEAITARVPSVHAMWVMLTASSAEYAASLLIKELGTTP